MTQKPAEFDFATVLASSIHDMKNSLSMLLGTLENITQGCDPKTCPSYQGFSQLQYEGKRINFNLIQLLALYRIKNSLYYVNINEHETHEFLHELQMQYQELLRLKSIDIEVACEPDLFWYYDKELITGVINNLINNSLKFTKGKIKLGAEIINSYLAISVADDGPGYPQDMLVADQHHQPEISFNSGSTGLGLYFASLVAELHKNKKKKSHGYITMTNDGIEGGSKFTVFLP